MTTWVALLRAVNLGATNRVPMPALRKALDEDGFTNTRSHLASGNLVLDSSLRSHTKVEDAVSAVIADLTGLSITVIARTPTQWVKLVSDNPFPAAAEDRPKQLHAALLAKGAVDEDAIQDRLTGNEQTRLVGDVLYIDYAEGVQNSKLTGAMLDKKLKVAATARNWNTVLAIAKLLENS